MLLNAMPTGGLACLGAIGPGAVIDLWDRQRTARTSRPPRVGGMSCFDQELPLHARELLTDRNSRVACKSVLLIGSSPAIQMHLIRLDYPPRGAPKNKTSHSHRFKPNRH